MERVISGKAVQSVGATLSVNEILQLATANRVVFSVAADEVHAAGSDSGYIEVGLTVSEQVGSIQRDTAGVVCRQVSQCRRNGGTHILP